MSAILGSRLAGLTVLAATAALAAGWQSAGPGSDSAVVQAVRLNPPEVDKPGWQALAAAHYLAAHPGQPAAKPAVADAKAAALKAALPPPPDVAVTFRQDLTAVVGAGSSVRLLMASLGPGKLLKRGSVYGDHWRLAELNDEDVVLKRGGDVRRIGLFGPAAKAAPIPTVFVVLPSAQQRQGQRPANAPAAANPAQPAPDDAAQGRGGRRGGGQGGGQGGGRNFGGQNGGQGGGRGRNGGGGPPADAPAPAPAPSTPPVVIVPGPGQAAAVTP